PQALEVLATQSQNIGIVITDQRMPGQQGVELLKQVRQKWPNMVRILITAFSELESAIEAVNSGAIFKYLTKPADLKTLREALSSSMQVFLTQVEKETLLREKMGTLQRMAVADRVRSLAALAAGISHHLRNSMTEMTCFLEEAGDKAAAPSPSGVDAYANEL